MTETNEPYSHPRAYLVSKVPFFSQVLEGVLDWLPGSIERIEDLSHITELKDSQYEVFIFTDQLDEEVDLCEEALMSRPWRDIFLFSFNGPDVYPSEIRNLMLSGPLLHCQLPCTVETLEKIKKCLDEKMTVQRSPEVLQALRNIAERRGDAYDSWQRHRTGNLMASVRLLNGAIRSRAYDLAKRDVYEQAEKAYAALLRGDDSWNDQKIEEDYNKAIGMIKKAISEIQLWGLESGLWHEKLKRILVVDDQEEMWRPVWEFIFGQDKIVMFSDGEEALEYIRNHGAEIDCMLLDLYLGENKRNGLELLPLIKAIQLDLPVVVMTAYDDSQVAREAYRRGAGFCFVKERRDQEDRNSKDYFNMFRKVIKSLPLSVAPERVSWRKFREIEEFFNKNGSLLSEIGGRLRKAFFFLLLDSEEARARHFLTGHTERDWPIGQFVIHFAYNAFEIFLDGTATTKPDLTLSVAEKYVLWLQGKRQTGMKTQPNLPNNIENYGGSGHHPRSIELTKYSIDKATSLLDSIIDWFRAYFTFNKISPSRGVAVPVGPSRSLLPWLETLGQRMAAEERENRHNDVSGHEKRGKSGALRLLQGALMEHGGEDILDQETIYGETEDVDGLIQYHEDVVLDLINREDHGNYVCLFVDDQGISSGWKRVLDLLLPVACVEYLEFTKDSSLEDVYEKAKTVDLAIFDLKLPEPSGQTSEKVGLKVLKEFCKRLPYLPVIVLTASDDAYYFRKVIQTGAFDCFPKTHQSSFNVDNSAYFTTYWKQFEDLIGLLIKHLEHSQPISRVIQGMESLNPFLMLKSVPIDSRLIDIPQPKKGILHERANKRLLNSLKTAYFLLTKHQNLGLQCLLDRLYFSETAKRHHTTAEFEAFTQAMKGAEYCCQILVGLSDPNSVFHTASRPLPLGELLRRAMNNQPEFWKKNRKTLLHLQGLWRVRNQIDHKITVNVPFEKLVLNAFLRIHKLTEAIAVDGREYLLKSIPQRLPKSMHFVPEILFLNLATEKHFEKSLAWIYECLFFEKMSELPEWTAEEWFRVIISHYFEMDQQIPDEEKVPELFPALGPFRQNLTIQRDTLLRNTNLKNFEKEAATYLEELASIEEEESDNLAKLYKNGSKVSFSVENEIRSRYAPKKEAYASKLNEIHRRQDQLVDEKREIEGTDIIGLLNQREEILDSWSEERSKRLEKQRIRAHFRRYLNWPGFVPFNEFCDACATFLISENKEKYQRLIEAVLSLPKFLVELRGTKGREALEMLFSKSMECLKALETMPLEYSVNGELVQEEACKIFKMRDNCIEIDTSILAENHKQGPHTLRMHCDDNNILKVHLEPQNEGGNFRL